MGLLQALVLTVILAGSQGYRNKWWNGWDNDNTYKYQNTEYCFEGGEADLKCSDGYLIDINWAVYKYSYYRYYRCSDPNASQKVKVFCDGLNSCTFTCDDQLFNDTTCTNRNERLTVCYKCVPDPCDSFYCANGGMCKLGSDLEPMCQCLGDWNGTHCDENPCNDIICTNGSCLVNATTGTAECCSTELSAGNNSPCVPETCPIGFRLLPNQASSTNCYSDSGASPANNRQWNQALLMCAMTPGAYLWRPNTVHEAAAVRNEFYLPNGADVWTGANDIDLDETFTFAIINGPFAIGNLPFGTGNANVVVGTDCVGIQFNGATWVWRDQLCANAHRYICEYPRRVCP